MTPSIPTASDIAAVVFPPIDDPIDPFNCGCSTCNHINRLEANEGICAQESDRD